MNTRFLDAFIWVARLGSFRSAAERLNMTQSAISSRIASLEADFGKRLFDRELREVRITTAGRILLDYAERISDLSREMTDAMAPDAKLRGTVRIGAIEAILYTWLIPFLERLRQVHDELEIELTAEPTVRLHEQLRRGQLDIALQTNTVLGDGIINQPMGTMPMGWIGRPGDDWDSGTPLSIERIVQRPTITMSRGSQPHDALLQACRHAGIHPKRVHCVGSLAAILRLVSAGFGAALVPLAPFREELSSGRLIVIPCSTRLTQLRLMMSMVKDPSTHTIDVIGAMAQQEAVRYALTVGPDFAVPAVAEFGNSPEIS
jgi:DNA-binding transcriptional LysR family regulator